MLFLPQARSLCTGLSNESIRKRKTGPVEGQPVPVGQGQVGPVETDFILENFGVSRNESVLSVLSESGIYFSGLVNHRLMCILLYTGVTVCVFSESVWKKSGTVFKPGPIGGRLATADGNELTVLGETKGRIRMGILLACYNSAGFSP